ncbi:MAG: peptidoglycan-binding domain-containing protein [Gemmobacter sp.]
MQFPPFRLALVLAVALAACTAPAAVGVDLSAGLVPATGTTPPAAPEGACWERAVTPAVIETVTEQVMATPERRGPDGAVIEPASFRTETRQEIVTDRRAVWFQTPCPEAVDVEFVATLQRALKARGLYGAPLTGALDAATRAAIRAWQRPRGLDSDVLSLDSARALGIVAVPRA